MSLSQTGTMMGESAAYGGFVDAAGGIVTIVLAMVGLSHTAPEMMVSVATIVFGAALFIQGGAMLSEYAQIVPTLSPEHPPNSAAAASPLYFWLARAHRARHSRLTGSSDGGADLGRDHRVRRGLDA